MHRGIEGYILEIESGSGNGLDKIERGIDRGGAEMGDNEEQKSLRT